MDVSCPRCKTEYEFDDARVPDSGVTVKCTSCNHVFRVRKKSAPPSQPLPVAVSAPSSSSLSSSSGLFLAQQPKVGDETLPARSPQAQAAVREWKVRQPSGNIFSFKELTTLQKWIVERKVSRDDEISLTGEAWKRLGNIAELASFFQIVDDAKKVHELEAMQQMKDKLSTKPGVEPSPLGGPPPPPPGDDSAPRMAAQSGQVPVPGERAGVMRAYDGTPPPQPKLHEAPTHPPDHPRNKLTETLRDPGFMSLPPRPPPEAPPKYKPPPLPVHSQQSQRREVLPDVEAETIRPPKKGGGAGAVIGLLLLLAGLGGAAGYYFVVWVPEQARLQETRDLEEKAKAEAAAKIAEEEARKAAEALEAEKKAQDAAEAEKKKKEEEEAKKTAVVPPTAAVDAGSPVVKKGTEKGTEKEGGPEKKETPKRSADYWISQGDRLRDKERAEAALDAYGKALDISPDNAEALTGKGLCFLDMAKPVQAEPVLERALKLNPRYAPAIMGLAESYRFQGKKESAIATYQKYLDTFPNGPEAGVAKSNIERLK